MPILVKISEGATSPNILFAENTGLLFAVLPPQRRFKWKSQQVDQMWEDILSACKENRESYFLGTLLLEDIGNGCVSVIDGQQRITTLSMLLAVLRDRCNEFDGLKKRSDTLQRLIGRVDHDGNPTGSLVIRLQEPDNQAYITLVKNEGSTDSVSSRSGLLDNAILRFKAHIENYLNVPDAEGTLRTLCNYVQDKIRLLPLEVRNEAEGYLVFDRTNTRGLRLTPSEGLKARLATIARQDAALSTELIEKWKTTATKFENAGLPIDAMDDYLHAIMCWREGYTAKRTLDRFVSKLTKSDDLRDFVKDFVRDLEYYRDSYLAVVTPSNKSSLSEDLKDLRGLNVQSHSFLTMAHRHFQSRFAEAVSLVLSLQIRNVTIGPYQANRYEKDWRKWAGLVREGSIDAAFTEIRNKLVSDNDFIRRFEKEEVISPLTVRHLLRRLDPISQPGSGVLPMDVDVEHVLPKSLLNKLKNSKDIKGNAAHWITDLGYEIPTSAQSKSNLAKELRPYLNRLGNQALLNDRANRGARDRPFSKKKGFYCNQALELTKELTEHDTWGLKEIAARQKALAEKAPSIWPK